MWGAMRSRTSRKLSRERVNIGGIYGCRCSALGSRLSALGSRRADIALEEHSMLPHTITCMTSRLNRAWASGLAITLGMVPGALHAQVVRGVVTDTTGTGVA